MLEEDFLVLRSCKILGNVLENTDLNMYLTCKKVCNMHYISNAHMT